MDPGHLSEVPSDPGDLQGNESKQKRSNKIQRETAAVYCCCGRLLVVAVAVVVVVAAAVETTCE